ncbi:muscle M-line assembly protein unc-89 isoform X8 [Nilaparvata lugens]|uniref:muscle M-line assembly protein unc-89 isoform X8 n=1 Tax=Nilaparvata lugens TaxID=108931 RepID=UPI00193E143B|nr:muscle M-line assembly protein unc-89 isoform X8 [Nilaparvata lugens]
MKVFSVCTTGSLKILTIIFLLILGAACILSQQVIKSNPSILLTQMKNCEVPKLKGNLYWRTSCSHGNHECDLEPLEPGSHVPGSGTVVKLQCLEKFIRKNEEIDFTVCFDGVWSPKIEACQKLMNLSVSIGQSSKAPLVGKEFTLYCKGKGYPIPNLTWFKDGRRLKGAEGNFSGLVRNLYEDNGPVLLIYFEKIIFSDSGTYRCLADNRNSTYSTSVTITVLGPVSITNTLALSKTIPNASTVDIPCTVAVAQLPITVEWYYFDKELFDDNEKISISKLICDGNATQCQKGTELCEENISCASTLTLSFITTRDSGTYVCVARNDVSLDRLHMDFRIEHVEAEGQINYRITLNPLHHLLTLI